MAERGVLVCERPDGRVDAFRARWGGSDRALARVATGPPRAAFGVADWGVDRRGVTPRTVIDTLNYLSTAALYWIGDRTRVALPLWFGLPGVGLDRADPGLGALAAVNSLSDARRLRRSWRALKGAVADAVLAGQLPPVGAPVVLLAALRGRACAFPAGLRPAAPSDVRSLL